MLTERPIDSALRSVLINNAPFVYAHLIKFERPARPEVNGRTSTSKERYTYLTDGSRDISFDDGSTSLSGVPNGAQIYLANKVLKVGSVSEQIQATPSNYTLVLDGSGIGAYASSAVSIVDVNSTTWDIVWPANIDLVQSGFREGDKVTFSNGRTGSFNINSFRANNTLRVTKIDNTLTAGTTTVNMSLSSEEIKSILLDKTSEEYASFVNREVFIYRGYFQNGEIIGSPVLLFKGIVSSVDFDENEDMIKVSWGLTSHWGDFTQVKGRITSDDFHRALDSSGVPQPQSALKVSYAYDKGFMHSETSLNVLATYNVQVQKQEVKAKNGFLGLGIGSKVKVRNYTVTEGRNTKLNLQLQAKSIPVIYGVRTITGIPIFADTLNNDSSTLYIAYALSEGEIGGIYDAYIDGNSLICNDKADFDARSQQTTDNTVELVCRGRADRGDVLTGASSVGTSISDFYSNEDYYITDFSYNYTTGRNYYQYIPPAITNVSTAGRGIVGGESINLTSPQKISMDVFSGGPTQKAASQLVEIAAANNFKIQNSYWQGNNTTEYWGPNHRLLDTAYVLTKVTIEEGETSNPDIEFVVKGKAVECYNYDYSYSHYTKSTSESAGNFALGDMVTLYNMSNQSLGDVQIIDKWTFVNTDGSYNTRFRFSSPPALNYANGVPTITKFYMKNSSNQTWTMVTYNYEEYRGTIGSTVQAPVTGVVNNNGNIAFDYPTNSNFGNALGGSVLDNYIPYMSLMDLSTGDNYYRQSNLFNTNRVLTGRSWSNGRYTTTYPIKVLPEAQVAVTANLSLVSRNTTVLASSASSVDNYYAGYYITVYRYDPTADKQYEQTKLIKEYRGATRTVIIDDVWDADIYPKEGDVVVIYPPQRDRRVSINPAMITLDYSTSKTYGKGLDVNKDIRLSSWLATARVCDTQSNVTINHTNNTVVPQGRVYRYPASGNIIWQGTVIGSDGNYTEFDNVIGKLTNNWNNWKSYNVGELVYADSNLYKVVSPGPKVTKPVHTSGTISGLEFVAPGSLTLSSTNGGPTLTLFVAGNPIRAMKNGTVIPGYSLYDCDEVTYWRYLGWDEFSQRYVTQHQTNLTIDTSVSLFDNTNSLLEHFGGILRYSAGKYDLDIETEEPPISNSNAEPKNITADQIIGKIRLSDDGTKTAYNSITAAFADPANKFESRNVSFFNSEYLKIDRNVPKKGNLSIPGITNYYNTRLLANKFLNKSRFGLTISFNMVPRGLLLLSGMVIQLQYPRYNWDNKKFRIVSITHQEDCTVDIVAEEYDESFYNLSKLSKQAGSGIIGQGTITTIDPPTNLNATSQSSGDELPVGVKITWRNNPIANPKNVFTEVYSSYSQNLYINVSSISGNVLSTVSPHGLVVGELITSQATLNGLENEKSYFVKTTPSTTTFTLSETKGGNTLGLSNGTSLGITMLTATLIDTVPVPTNYILDPSGGKDGRISKYYWVRHKVVKE